MTRPRKNLGARGIWTWDLPLLRRMPWPLGQQGSLTCSVMASATVFLARVWVQVSVGLSDFSMCHFSPPNKQTKNAKRQKPNQNNPHTAGFVGSHTPCIHSHFSKGKTSLGVHHESTHTHIFKNRTLHSVHSRYAHNYTLTCNKKPQDLLLQDLIMNKILCSRTCLWTKFSIPWLVYKQNPVFQNLFINKILCSKICM